VFSTVCSCGKKIYLWRKNFLTNSRTLSTHATHELSLLTLVNLKFVEFFLGVFCFYFEKFTFGNLWQTSGRPPCSRRYKFSTFKAPQSLYFRLIIITIYYYYFFCLKRYKFSKFKAPLTVAFLSFICYWYLSCSRRYKFSKFKAA
jgi:hypothetical protein